MTRTEKLIWLVCVLGAFAMGFLLSGCSRPAPKPAWNNDLYVPQIIVWTRDSGSNIIYRVEVGGLFGYFYVTNPIIYDSVTHKPVTVQVQAGYP